MRVAAALNCSILSAAILYSYYLDYLQQEEYLACNALDRVSRSLLGSFSSKPYVPRK